jgi:hypothetical protein
VVRYTVHCSRQASCVPSLLRPSVRLTTQKLRSTVTKGACLRSRAVTAKLSWPFFLAPKVSLRNSASVSVAVLPKLPTDPQRQQNQRDVMCLGKAPPGNGHIDFCSVFFCEQTLSCVKDKYEHEQSQSINIYCIIHGLNVRCVRWMFMKKYWVKLITCCVRWWITIWPFDRFNAKISSGPTREIATPTTWLKLAAEILLFSYFVK